MFIALQRKGEGTGQKRVDEKKRGRRRKKDQQRSLVLILALNITRCVRGPECEVVAEELHDEGAVFVRLLVEGVELGNGIVKRLLGKVAGLVGGVLDLVVEDGEVEGQAEADGMGGCHL